MTLPRIEPETFLGLQHSSGLKGSSSRPPSFLGEFSKSQWHKKRAEPDIRHKYLFWWFFVVLTFHLPSNLFVAPPPPGPQTDWKASGRFPFVSLRRRRRTRDTVRIVVFVGGSLLETSVLFVWKRNLDRWGIEKPTKIWSGGGAEGGFGALPQRKSGLWWPLLPPSSVTEFWGVSKFRGRLIFSTHVLAPLDHQLKKSFLWGKIENNEYLFFAFTVHGFWMAGVGRGG